MQVLWGLHLFLTPLYIFKSGLPQPADILAFFPGLFAISMYLMQGNLFPRGPFLPVILFALQAAIVNGLHFIFLTDSVFLKSTLFYAYNLLIFSFGCLLLRDDFNGTSRISIWAIGLALIAQALWVLAFPERGYVRESGWFNNPNQLGYWALLGLSSVAVLAGGRLRAYHFVFIACAVLLGLLSTSKAVLVCFLVLVPLVFLGPQSNMFARLIFIGAVSVTLVWAAATFGSLNNAAGNIRVIDKTVQRFATIGNDPDDTFAGRGYDRIARFPQYLVFGAGEGGYARFSSDLFRELELHSGIGTILFCYGIIGLILFGWFLWGVIAGAPLYNAAYALMPVLYGLTHQNLRFTSFWILLAFVYMVTWHRKHLNER